MHNGEKEVGKPLSRAGYYRLARGVHIDHNTLSRTVAGSKGPSFEPKK